MRFNNVKATNVGRFDLAFFYSVRVDTVMERTVDRFLRRCDLEVKPVGYPTSGIWAKTSRASEGTLLPSTRIRMINACGRPEISVQIMSSFARVTHEARQEHALVWRRSQTLYSLQRVAMNTKRSAANSDPPSPARLRSQ